MRFDQIIFQNQGFYFTVSDSIGNISNISDQINDAVAMLFGRNKIAGDSFFEIFGFTYVNDFPFLIEKSINSWLIGQDFYLFQYFRVFIHWQLVKDIKIVRRNSFFIRLHTPIEKRFVGVITVEAYIKSVRSWEAIIIGKTNFSIFI